MSFAPKIPGRRKQLEQELDPDGDGLFNTSEMDELDQLFPPPKPYQHRYAWEQEGDALLLGGEIEPYRNYTPAHSPSVIPTVPMNFRPAHAASSNWVPMERRSGYDYSLRLRGR